MEVQVSDTPCCLTHPGAGRHTLTEEGAFLTLAQGSAALLLSIPCSCIFLYLRFALTYYNFRLRGIVQDQLVQAPCFTHWGKLRLRGVESWGHPAGCGSAPRSTPEF